MGKEPRTSCFFTHSIIQNRLLKGEAPWLIIRITCAVCAAPGSRLPRQPVNAAAEQTAARIRTTTSRHTCRRQWHTYPGRTGKMSTIPARRWRAEPYSRNSTNHFSEKEGCADEYAEQLHPEHQPDESPPADESDQSGQLRSR